MLGPTTGTKQDILEVLRSRTEAPIKDLSEAVGISPSTLREHLSELEALNLIDKRSDRDGPGRPRHLYFLSEDAEALFPHSYADLSSKLLEIVLTLSDEKHVKQKLTDLMQETIEEFDTLESALQAMGFYPEIKQGDSQSDRTIIFHQCPFHEVAQDNPLLCDVDEALLTEVIQKTVEKKCCIASDANRCVFIVNE